MKSNEKLKPTAHGTFEKTPFAHVLIYLIEHQSTGSFVAEDGQNRVIVYFQKGTPCKVRSTVEGKELAKILFELELISEDALERCREQKEKEGGLCGQTLLQEGMIDGQALVRGIREQMLSKMLDVFAMQVSAQYLFYDTVNLLAGYGLDEVFPLDPYILLLAGVRDHFEKQPIRGVLQSLSGRWVSLADPETIRRFRPDPDERKLCMELLQGSKSFDELLHSKSRDIRVVARVLYVLRITKLLEIKEDAPDPTVAPIPPVAESQLTSIPPAPTQNVEEDPEKAARRERIKTKAATIGSQNLYEMLEIDREATIGDIKKSFFKLVKIFHPDRAQGEWVADLKETLGYVFTNLTEAHATLTDADARELYDKTLEKGITAEQQKAEVTAEEREVRMVLEAEKSFQKAQFFLRRDQFPEALENVEAALVGQPLESEYIALRAHLQGIIRTKDEPVNDLVDVLRRALSASEKSDRIRFYLAKMLVRADHVNEAADHFKKILEKKPHHPEAGREIRMIELRKKRQEKEQQTGLFKKLFKR